MSSVPVPIAGSVGNVAWAVTGAQQGTGQTASGQYVRGWEVAYQLGSGHAGTVFLPGPELVPDLVRAATAAAAAQLAAVLNLSS